MLSQRLDQRVYSITSSIDHWSMSGGIVCLLLLIFIPCSLCMFGVDMEFLFIFAMLELACFSFCRAFARIFLFAMLLHAFLFGSISLLLEI